MTRPSFLITIDTEGDNIWSRPREITTVNARFLPRFQALCERYGFRPTYLTNYEMASCPVFREFGFDLLKRATGEIGMHLHAWNSPPLVPLTSDDLGCQPYLMEYPEPTIREKVKYLTALLEDTFAVDMVSHRAGRWGMSPAYAQTLVDNGYTVDCSVTPHVSWKHHTGGLPGSGGSDYTDFPEHPYRMDPDYLDRPGRSPLLQLPVTVVSFPTPGPLKFLPARIANRLYPKRAWFRPTGKNRSLMLRIVEVVLEQKRPYLEFVLHSSEFMPGGSPVFPAERDIEVLYADLEAVFEAVARNFKGNTLAGFARDYASTEPASSR